MKTFFFGVVTVHQFLSPVFADEATKIVGGVETVKGRYPYQVAMMAEDFQYCGGSLVDEYWVLSAAHCKSRGGTPSVRIGSFNLATDDPNDYETIEIDWETKHPDYDDSTLENDFMMVKLKEPSLYATVKLDDGSNTLEKDTDVTVMGWGTTSSGGPASDVLLEVEVDIVDNSDCNDMYSQEEITDNMICAAREGKDSCQGDSGGPLILKGSSAPQDILVGVVSWGYGCADAEYPGVYARITAQSDWITEQIESGIRPENDDEWGNDNWGSDDWNWDDNWNWDDYEGDDQLSEIGGLFFTLIRSVLKLLIALVGGGEEEGEERR